MRKTIIVTLALLLLWVGYLAWPLYDLYTLAKAVESGDILTASRRIDFRRVRLSLTRQLVDTYMQRTGSRQGALVQTLVGSVADPVVDRIVSPEAFADLLRVGWPRNVLSDAPHDPPGISVQSLGNAWTLFAASNYGFGRYEISVPPSFPPKLALGLEMRMGGRHWRLAGVELPEHIRNLIVDEIIKSLKVQAP